MNIPEVSLLIACMVVAYTYVGYPIIIGMLPSHKKVSRPLPQSIPSISILVVAHNEASCIADKIKGILALEVGGNRPEIVIASDGSTDETCAIARRFSRCGVRVVPFESNRGKPSVLNQLVPELSGEIVVLMDARQSIEKEAVLTLLAGFSDPEVGAVSGELRLQSSLDHGASLEGIGFYWRYEKYIRLNESRVDSAIGVTGAFYAFRRELYAPIPESTLLDDVLIPMNIARKGYRVLFMPGAIICDHLSSDPAAEFRRKVRTIAGNFQLFHLHPWLLLPRSNRLWWQSISHKVLRLLGPLLLFIIFFSNILLLGDNLYRALFTLQCVFYGAAAIGHYSPELRGRFSFLSIPHAFCLLNWSTAIGFLRYLRGEQRVTWHQNKQSAG